MTATGSDLDLIASNQQGIVAELSRVRAFLERREHPGEPVDPPGLATIVSGFDLSPFERDLLLLCAGVEFDSAFTSLLADAQGDARLAYPTFGLALATLPGAHWSALSPEGPLRRWRLINGDWDGPLTQTRLRIAERVLHHLTGVPASDERLRCLVSPLSIDGDVGSQSILADRIARALVAGELIELCGSDTAGVAALVASSADKLGARAFLLEAANAPSLPSDRELFARLWEREAVLTGSILFVDTGDSTEDLDRCIAQIAEAVDAPCVIGTRQRLRSYRRAVVRVDVAPLGAEDRLGLWQAVLGSDAPAELCDVADEFALDLHGIRSAAAAVKRGDDMRGACRSQARPRLHDLAQRIEPAAAWDDLVLPERELLTLREIAVHVRSRRIVYDEWGWRSRGSRGLGIAALFAGPSGTGKTMAAEVLARDLDLDLHRIDLSAVVSKYIGETEKNLRRVFDAAETGGAILLFDEADALFGKRSEVKDSHDRYANIEVGYLLQRMEAYRGLAILTTNMRHALDEAFLRRIRFVVAFPFPDQQQRVEIWRRMFPAETPTDGLDPARLARLNVAGGTIRNIALNGAFLAADAGEPVGMPHLLRAARTECAKLERPILEAELGGWV